MGLGQQSVTSPPTRDPGAVNILGRVFGRRRFERPEPGPADIARVDLTRMIATARDRGDRRTEPEVVAALMLGADLTADRHHDAEMRLVRLRPSRRAVVGLSVMSARTPRPGC